MSLRDEVKSLILDSYEPWAAQALIDVFDKSDDLLADVTPGTAAASKALVLDASKAIATITALTATTLAATTLGIAGATTMTAGAATAAVALRLGASVTEGLEIKAYDDITELTNAASTDTTCVLPAGAVILSVQGNLEAAITGDESGDDLLADIGIGISGGDEDAYAEFGALTKNAKADAIPDWAVLAAETTLAIFGLQADGDTACTEKFTGGTGQSVRLRVVYAVCNSLDDA